MIRVITVDREYGTGAPAITKGLAVRLGWALWDQRLSEEIARVAECDLAAVESREEREDPLYYRLFKSFLRGSYEGNLNLPQLNLLDADSIVSLSETLVHDVAAAGRCIIVGRGAQYFLGDRPDVYHVFIYAPYEEKIRREREAGRSADEAAQLVETVDQERAAFIKRYFAKDWPNRALYHLMVNSVIGNDATIETIVQGIAALDKVAAG